MTDTRNLVLKGRKWWCMQAVPRELRPALGKANLLMNLGTGDITEAQRRRTRALAEFARLIDKVRAAGPSQDDGIEARALVWRQVHDEALAATADDPDELDAVEGLLYDEAEQIERNQGEAAAQRFYRVATSQATPLLLYLNQCMSEAVVKPLTIMERKAAVRRFAEWAGQRCVEDIDRKLAGRYASEVLACMNRGTANKHLGGLAAYWKWLVMRGHAQASPWLGQRFKPKSNGGVAVELDGERTFTDAELVMLLNGPADRRLHDAMVIAALSGMRIAELCSLRVEDCAGGLFDIKRAKNNNSVRKVPIHSQLTALVASRCAGKAPTDYLIHELGEAPDPTTGRQRSMPLSKQFTRYRRALKIEERVEGTRRSRVNFHSFRRWFSTKARHHEPPLRDSDIEFVTGHAPQTMLLKRYAKEAAIAQLRAVVEAVSLPAKAHLSAKQ